MSTLIQLFSKNRYLSTVLDWHFVYKEKAKLQPRVPMVLVIYLCSPFTSLSNGFPGFISAGLSKFVSYVEASATQGENKSQLLESLIGHIWG